MRVLDSGGVTRLAERSQQAAALILAFGEEDHPGRDALANRFLETCDILEEVTEPLARRAAQLRKLARRGSAFDALVVALAEPGGTVLTSDPGDLGALAQYAHDVSVETV